MERPYIICHMLSSIDGRISGDFFSLPQTGVAGQVTSRIRENYACDGALNGTVTAAEIYAKGYVKDLPNAAGELPRKDWIAPHEEKQFAIAPDAEGTLNWQGGTVRRNGKAPAHAVAILTKQVSNDYLSFLRQRGVSYLFAGERRIDLPLAMRKLKKRLGIERLLLTGGGVINWAMLEAGLIDEFSLVIAPVVDGTVGQASLFDRSEYAATHLPAAFELRDMRLDDGGVVWLKYLCRKEDENDDA